MFRIESEIANNIKDIIPFYFLYAEIHYKLLGKFSLLSRNLPEMIADVPFRIEPNTEIPIFCIIKDADIFPIKLDRIDIELIYPDHHKEKIIIPFPGLEISEKLWKKVFFVNVSNKYSGKLKVNVYFSLTSNNKDYYFRNDNYKKLDHRPFEVFIANENFPSFEDCAYGELHIHSYNTSNVVEFGAPIDMGKEAAASMGIDFFVAADHSYCFGYTFDFNSQKYNKEENKWETAKKSASDLNKYKSSRNGKKVFVFQGQEVSCGSKEDKNIHLILFNYDKFVPGYGDSGMDLFKNDPDVKLENILSEIDDSAVAFASHPEVKYRYSERLLLKRSGWTKDDYKHKNLLGLEILNGALDSSFFRGLKRWRELLLSGEKKFIAAGSDAHGNFNRFRQAKIPIFTMRENRLHIFGNVRTGVFLNKPFSEKAIVDGLKKGCFFVTNGPAVKFFIKNEKNQVKVTGETIEGKEFTVDFEVRSNGEFGRINDTKIYLGDLDSGKEVIFKHFPKVNEYSIKKETPLFFSSNNCYLRIEAVTERRGRRYMCFTNPLWIKRI